MLTDPKYWEPYKRFYYHIDVQPGGCWTWGGALDVSGYGTFYVDNKQIKAHRWAYEFMVGPIPMGYQIDHLCRNRACVNHSHLEAVTQQENIRRGEVGRNSREKTHCPSGHPYDEKNTYITKSGSRSCRACKRDWARRDKEGSNADVRASA